MRQHYRHGKQVLHGWPCDSVHLWIWPQGGHGGSPRRFKVGTEREVCCLEIYPGSSFVEKKAEWLLKKSKNYLFVAQ